MAKTKIGKKSKSKDERPARKRYWSSKHLERNKVKNLMRNGFTRAEATEHWQSARNNRRTPYGSIIKAKTG